MCCHLPLDPKLGGAKVYIENAKAYEGHGHQVKLLGVDDLGESFSHLPLEERIAKYPLKLKEFLEREGESYDVVEFEYLYFPFKKPANCKKSIFVARSVLLEYHLLDFYLPRQKGNYFLNFLKDLKQKYLLKKRCNAATETIKNADFVNVPNNLDKDRLLKEGVPPEKIIVSPYGSFNESKILNPNSNKKNLAYVATFDPRKGCYDLPKIINNIRDTHPDASLFLLGAKGRFQTSEQILSHFAKGDQEHTKVTLSFNSGELDQLLFDVGVGVFPSYLESFGFGLLEMTERGIPCVAYKIPGPSDLIPEYLQTERGDLESISKILKRLIEDPEFYKKAQVECLEISKQFDWKKTSLISIEKYEATLNE